LLSEKFKTAAFLCVYRQLGHIGEGIMLQGEDVQTLTGFGLTFLQAKVYLTLVRTGNSTVRKIAEKANIARQEVQRVAAELQSLGLVEKLLVNPTEFEPLPINDAVTFLLERRGKVSLELEQKANMLLKNFANNQVGSIDEEKMAQFVITSEKEAIIRKSKMVVDRTKESCDIINGLWKNVGYASSLFKEQNIHALKRHVKIRIAAEKLPEQQSVGEIYKHSIASPYFKIKFIPFSVPASLGIYDKKELLVCTSPEKLIGDSPMLWTNNPALIAAVQTYFNKLWKQSVPSLNSYSSKNVKVVSDIFSH
jgi:sugar-specific transcriptional regulator TrmB